MGRPTFGTTVHFYIVAVGLCCGCGGIKWAQGWVEGLVQGVSFCVLPRLSEIWVDGLYLSDRRLADFRDRRVLARPHQRQQGCAVCRALLRLEHNNGLSENVGQQAAPERAAGAAARKPHG